MNPLRGKREHMVKDRGADTVGTLTAEAWHVVETNARNEILAAQSIRELGIEIYLPEYIQRIRHARKSELVRRALFPGYLFARFATDNPHWPRIFSRRGVRSMIMDGQRPRPVPEDQMQAVRDIAGDYNGVVCEAVPLNKGQVVRIIEGAFTAFPATVIRADETNTLTVQAKVFGRSTDIILPRDHVVPITNQ